jgi:hypothetical protein
MLVSVAKPVGKSADPVMASFLAFLARIPGKRHCQGSGSHQAIKPMSDGSVKRPPSGHCPDHSSESPSSGWCGSWNRRRWFSGAVSFDPQSVIRGWARRSDHVERGLDIASRHCLVRLLHCRPSSDTNRPYDRASLRLRERFGLHKTAHSSRLQLNSRHRSRIEGRLIVSLHPYSFSRAATHRTAGLL